MPTCRVPKVACSTNLRAGRRGHLLQNPGATSRGEEPAGGVQQPPIDAAPPARVRSWAAGVGAGAHGAGARVNVFDARGVAGGDMRVRRPASFNGWLCVLRRVLRGYPLWCLNDMIR